MSATGAAAARPLKESFGGPSQSTNTTLCGFSIEIETQSSGFQTIHFNEAGSPVRFQAHITAQDTFTANGVTLVGEKYRTMIKGRIANGELVEVIGSGVLEKVRLADGTIFMGAGRVDFLAAEAGGVFFVVDPDSGVSKNLDAFCDTLS
jgi:hypothetical protein